MIENLNDGKVMFALLSIPLGVSNKLLYVAWCGEGVTGMKKGLFNNQAQDVGFLFKVKSGRTYPLKSSSCRDSTCKSTHEAKVILIPRL